MIRSGHRSNYANSWKIKRSECVQGQTGIHNKILAQIQKSLVTLAFYLTSTKMCLPAISAHETRFQVNLLDLTKMYTSLSSSTIKHAEGFNEGNHIVLSMDGGRACFSSMTGMLLMVLILTLH